MMAATSAGSYVLQQQSNVTVSPSGTITTTMAPQNAGQQSLALRTLQGIKVIPMQSNHQPRLNNNNAVISGQPSNSGQPAQHHQLVARILTSRPGVQPAQIVIPSSSNFQPVLVAQQAQQQQVQQSSNSLHQLQQAPQQIAISVQPQKSVNSSQQLTTVALPIQTQKR